MKGREANLLANRKEQKKGDVFDRVLSSCWLETIDPGPYEVGEDGRIPWAKVLQCDRFYTLVCIRIATYGPQFAFEVQCGRTSRTTGGGCDEKIEWELNLLEDLDVYDLPEESREKIAKGENVFEAMMGDRRVTFQLLTGELERKLSKKVQGNEDQQVTMALAQRIIEIEGVDRRKRLEFLDDHDFDQQVELLEELEEADGGVESRIEIQCPRPECKVIQEVALPFGGDAFWTPRKRGKASSRKRKPRTARTMSGKSRAEEEPDEEQE